MAVEVETVGTIADLVATVVPVADKLVWVQRYRMMQANGQELRRRRRAKMRFHAY
jgi:hypothetical protein